MKRPLAIIGFTCLIVLVVASFLNINTAVILAGLSLLLFAVSLFIPKLRRDKTIPTVLLTCVVSLSVFIGVYYFRYLPATALDGKQQIIEGQIVELPQGSQYDRYYYIVEADNFEFNGHGLKIKMRLSSSQDLYCEPYDRISAQVKISLPSDGEGFSSLKHYRANGIYLYCYPTDFVKITSPEKRPLMYYPKMLKSKMTGYVSSLLSRETAGILRAVMFGDETAMSSGDLNAVRRSGLAHVMAVSGLHLSIIVSAVYLLLSRFRIDKRICSALSIVFVILFIAVTGFSPSIIRAGVMNLLIHLGLIIGRRPDPYNSLGLSAIILLIANPFAASDVSLLLSFSATLGLLVLMPKIYGFLMSLRFVRRLKALSKSAYESNTVAEESIDSLNIDTDDIIIRMQDDFVDSIIDMSPEQILRVRDSIDHIDEVQDNDAVDASDNDNNDTQNKDIKPKEKLQIFTSRLCRLCYNIIKYAFATLSCTVAATLFTLPITIVCFDSVTLMSPLSNLICLLPASIMMVCGHITAIFGIMPALSFLSKPFGLIAGVLAKFILWWCRLTADMPISALSTDNAYIMITVGAVLLLTAFAIFISLHKNRQSDKANNKKYYVIIALLSLIILFGGILSYLILYADVAEIAVINQDESASIVIMDNGKAVVIGCGGAYNADKRVADVLASRGISQIDMLILQKCDENYASHANSLLEQYDTLSVFALPGGEYYDDLIDTAFSKGIRISDLNDCSMELWENIKLDISIIQEESLITIDCGETSILLAAKDADAAMLSEKDRQYDIAVYDNELPANYQLIQADCAIISGNAKNSAVTALRLKKSETDSFMLCDYDRLVIQTRGKGDITLRQE